jgi:protein CpxP
MRSIRLLALSLCTLTHAAAAQATPAAHPAPQAAPKVDRDDHGGARMEQMHDMMFKGITLSADEKAKIKSVHEKYRSQAKTLQQGGRADRQDAAADRKRGDTTDARKAVAKGKAERDDMREMRTHMEGDLREALSPEHRSQFDINVRDMKARHDERVETRQGKREEKREEKHERQRDAKADRAGTARP